MVRIYRLVRPSVGHSHLGSLRFCRHSIFSTNDVLFYQSRALTTAMALSMPFTTAKFYIIYTWRMNALYVIQSHCFPFHSLVKMVKKDEFLKQNGHHESNNKQVTRSDFPPDFVFGVATSAYQVFLFVLIFKFLATSLLGFSIFFFPFFQIHAYMSPILIWLYFYRVKCSLLFSFFANSDLGMSQNPILK